MKRGEYDYAYNAQAAEDVERGVIVAAGLTNVAPDVGYLPVLADQVRALRDVAELPGSHPMTVSADAGYFSGENAAHNGDGLDLLIAEGRDDSATAASRSGVWSAECFGYDAARDIWVCPTARRLGEPATIGHGQEHAGADHPIRPLAPHPCDPLRLLLAPHHPWPRDSYLAPSGRRNANAGLKGPRRAN